VASGQSAVEGEQRVVVLRDDQVLLKDGRLPVGSDLPTAIGSVIPLIMKPSVAVLVCPGHARTVGGMTWSSSSGAMASLPDHEREELVFGLQMTNSPSRGRHCRNCGSAQRQLNVLTGRATCLSCGAVEYPRLDPAVMVLVQRGDDVLLVRRKASGTFSAVTGFVDLGESAEKACHREVLEETGVVMTAPRYVASLSWPGPHSLMLGFVAQHLHGTPAADGVENDSAAYFPISELPPLVARPNIVHALLEVFSREARVGE
jgi:NADH pyrophosphatase NudC (nudix superfamily)